MARTKKRAATRGRKTIPVADANPTESEKDTSDTDSGLVTKTTKRGGRDERHESQAEWEMRDRGRHSETGGKEPEESGSQSEHGTGDAEVNPGNVVGGGIDVTGEGGGGDVRENVDGGTQVPLADEEVWTDAKEDELIDLYRDSPHLWNKEAPGFKMRNKKDIAATEWSVKLGIDKVNVIARLKYLRDVYGRAINPGASGSAPKKFTARQQHIIKRLSFLAGHVIPRNVTMSTKRSAKKKSSPAKVAPSSTPRASSRSADLSHEEVSGQGSVDADKGIPGAGTISAGAPRAESSSSNIVQDAVYVHDDGSTTGNAGSPYEMSAQEQCDGGGQKRTQSPDPSLDMSASKRRKASARESDSFNECEEVPYINILKDLADAVKRPTPPPPPVPAQQTKKQSQLQLWGELLLSNMSDLPIEMQHEARFNIDSYVLSLRRQVKPYAVSTPKKGVGKNVKTKPTATGQSNAACASFQQQQQQQLLQQQQQQQACEILENLQVSPCHSLPSTPTRQHSNLHQMQSALGAQLPQYSPMSQVYVPPGIGESPNTARLLSQLMSGAPQSAQYQGHM